MATFLFAWNPKKWKWKEGELTKQVLSRGNWFCGGFMELRKPKGPPGWQPVLPNSLRERTQRHCGIRSDNVPPELGPHWDAVSTFYVDSPSDPIIAEAAITSASGVFYDGSTSDVGFTFPSGNFFGFSSGYFGPNFEFTTGVVTPDSGSTVSLLSFALLGLAMLRRKLGC